MNKTSLRCTRYLRYAEALAGRSGICTETVYDQELTGRCGCLPRALLVDGSPVRPSDGVIVAPETLTGALAGTGAGLVELLQAAQDAMMEEWAEQGDGA